MSTRRLPTDELESELLNAGWQSLNNTRGRMRVLGNSIDMRGVNDPHIRLDRYDDVAGPFDPDASLRLAVTHAPYLRVLDPMAADGADLIIACGGDGTVLQTAHRARGSGVPILDRQQDGVHRERMNRGEAQGEVGGDRNSCHHPPPRLLKFFQVSTKPLIRERFFYFPSLKYFKERGGRCRGA